MEEERSPPTHSNQNIFRYDNSNLSIAKGEGRNMEAYKLKGTIDAVGNLVITEPVKMPPGDVEVIVLQAVETVASATVRVTESAEAKPKRKVQCRVEAFRDLFENTEPAPPDFDPEQARWEALKEKYNL